MVGGSPEPELEVWEGKGLLDPAWEKQQRKVSLRNKDKGCRDFRGKH